MLKDLLGTDDISLEPVSRSGLAALMGLAPREGKSLPAAMNELQSRQRDKAAMLDRIRARRKTSFGSDELDTVQQAHKRNKALDAAEAALNNGDF